MFDYTFNDFKFSYKSLCYHTKKKCLMTVFSIKTSKITYIFDNKK